MSWDLQSIRALNGTDTWSDAECEAMADRWNAADAERTGPEAKKQAAAAIRYFHETKPLVIPTSATGLDADVTLDMSRDARRTLTEIKECFNSDLITETIFKDYIGVFQTVTKTQFTVLWASAASRVAAAYLRESEICSAIEGEEEYDTEAGWPS